MNYVERVNEYTHELPCEAYEGDISPSDEWPGGGAISFRSVTMKYQSAAAPVFSNLSFDVAPKTRVGVVGRTGAGKSSLAVALFRELEAISGAICIDGVDVSRVPLHSLRSRLTIIQQEPASHKRQVRGYKLRITSSST